MAVAIPFGDRIDNYELELNRVREKIKTKFVELIDCLKSREDELLRKLDNFRTSYLAYRSELKKVNQKKLDIEKTRTVLQNELPGSTIESVHQDFIARLNTELKSIKTPKEPKVVSFECDSNKMLAELNKLGRLIEKLRENDYREKKQPLLSVSDRGNLMEQLNLPLGLKIDNNTGYIYIADQHNRCVKVFTGAGKHLYKIVVDHNPNDVAIYEDRMFVSQCNHSILIYKLDGKLLSSIGKKGKGELEFNYPYGLAINELNGDIYICDYGNDRVQIVDKGLIFRFQFGNSQLKKPRDVKLSKECIFVLDEYNPCLHLFSHNLILQKSVISRGLGLEVVNPYFFFIDQTDTILISDHEYNSIIIFTSQFRKTHTITTSKNPMGIAVDKGGRVIVVTQAVKSCLQIF